MTDFFSEFLHVSQVYTLPTDTPPANREETESGQVLISQRTRKRPEQDQIDEIVNLYSRITKEDNETPEEPPEPAFTEFK